jgi:beta-lactam-binding protein with PASTA domain
MMPNLVGLSVVAAYQQLDSIGQSGSREATCDAGSPGSDPNNGTVTSQNIAAGDMLPTFKGVAVGVACGVAATPPDELFLD